MSIDLSSSKSASTLLAIAVGLSACALPESAKTPGAKAKPKDISSLCYNLEYAFTCVPPPGFVITQENPGPGQIMTLVKRSHTTLEEPNLALRAYPLIAGNFQKYVERKILRPLEQAAGVKLIGFKETQVGGRDGLLITLDREYASGTVHMRIFCFSYGKNVYLIEYTEPALRIQRDPSVLEAFVQSIAFR